MRALTPPLEDIGKLISILDVQDDGGSLKATEKGIEAASRYVKELAVQQRTPISWEKRLVAMECGRSDAMSGMTANVAIGAVSDWLVAQGATVMFGENTEMVGTAHVLARRAEDHATGDTIERMVERAENLTHTIKGEMANRVIAPG